MSVRGGGGLARPAGKLRPSGEAGKAAQREGRGDGPGEGVGQEGGQERAGRPGWEGGYGFCWAGSRWPGPVGPNWGKE
jgi:hypothetical protein